MLIYRLFIPTFRNYDGNLSRIESTSRKKEIAEYGITASVLGLSTGAKKGTKKVGSSTPAVVRYKNDNGETWSGMGHQLQWIKGALAEGKSKEDFAV